MASPLPEKADSYSHLEKVSSSDSPVIGGRGEELPPIDPALDARITQIFDRRVVPWLFGLWLLAFIDRSNIGNAKIDGLVDDLKLVGTKYNVALTVFYVPYILIDVPSNWFVKRVGAGFYLPGLVIVWGVVGMCIGFVKSYSGLIAARFFLGLCEGGLLGGMILYLSMFYRRHQVLFRMGLFYCAAPLSGAFGGLLATGLAEIKHGGYNGWPWIFIVEGIITILFGILTMFFLPHTPGSTKFLTPEQRDGALARMKLDAHGATTISDVKQERFDWKSVRMAVFNVNSILCSLNFFAIITPIYSFSLFLPTIISALGYKQVKAQLFTVPPNMLGFFAVLFCTWLSDRIKMRGPIMIVTCSIAIVGYVMLLASEKATIQYGGTFLIAAGIFPSSPMVMGWLANNLAPHYTRATGVGLQICIANCAAFIATFTYLTKDAPRFVAGHSINIGMLAWSIALSVMTVLYCTWENKKRERGERDERLLEDGGKQELLGYRHPSFRYTI
ncbi:hypothetical protein MMC25_000509 [Agyrium rufum]|nr:hypothetical protein [Agyrium rufum]